MSLASTSNEPQQNLIEVSDLSVSFKGPDGTTQILENLSFDLPSGSSLGVVGESGCGKSTLALALTNYLPEGAFISTGKVVVDGIDVGSLRGADLRNYWAKTVASVYQDPGASLNPTLKVGDQIAEVLRFGSKMSKDEARKVVEATLERVRFPEPSMVYSRYPHQLSGGQQQRIVIAMALAARPKLLLLDEPTTGLDATVEAEVLDLIAEIRATSQMSMVLISHNLGVVARNCDTMAVLYGGRLVEIGPSEQILHSPKHPYTKALLECIPLPGARKGSIPLKSIPGSVPAPGQNPQGCVFAPRCNSAKDICRVDEPKAATFGDGSQTSFCHFADQVKVELPTATKRAQQLSVENIQRTGDTPEVALLHLEKIDVSYHTAQGKFNAIQSLDISIAKGEVLGVVGESGSGKSTLAKALAGMIEMSAGEVFYLGRLIKPDERKKFAQIVLQNPDAAMNQRRRVGKVMARFVSKLTGVKGAEALLRTKELAESVRLTPEVMASLPRQLSGGQKQRVAIACALAGVPDLLICDEPTSALDVSVQAAILNLLTQLQTERQLSMLFISHDLAVVGYIADRIAVMYLGQIVEIFPVGSMSSPVHHPYTEALLSASPVDVGLYEGRIRLSGEMPSPINPPTGCRFNTRCHRVVTGLCEVVEPPWRETEDGISYRCHLTAEQMIPIGALTQRNLRVVDGGQARETS